MARTSFLLVLAVAITATSQAPGEKLVRDAYSDSIPHQHLTPNFAIKWGNAYPVDRAEMVRFGQALETSWRVIVNERGYPPPIGAETFRLNVYMGSSDPLLPSLTNGRVGYTQFAPERYPMIVLGPIYFPPHTPGTPSAWRPTSSFTPPRSPNQRSWVTSCVTYWVSVSPLRRFGTLRRALPG